APVDLVRLAGPDVVCEVVQLDGDVGGVDVLGGTLVFGPLRPEQGGGDAVQRVAADGLAERAAGQQVVAELDGHRAAGPVPRHRHGAVRAVQGALAVVRAGSGRDVGELHEHAGFALVEADQRVVAGGPEEIGLEVVDPGCGRHTGGAAPQRLGDEGGAEGGLQVAQVVVEDVQEVHAHVQGHRACLAD